MLQPYIANISKRIIKSPKVYFMDMGLCSYLCKMHDSKMLQDSCLSEALFETYVVSEIVKGFYNNNVNPQDYLFYYRDIDRKEIDLLYLHNGSLCPIEIKKNSNPTKPNKNFGVLEKYNMNILPGFVIDSASSIRAINEKVFVLPESFIGL